MVDLDYIVDGLTELAGDETQLNPTRMQTMSDIITSSLNSSLNELYKFDINTQMRFTNKVQGILLRSQFACMLVYTRFKSYPGFNDLFILTRSRMARIASEGSIDTFLNTFYLKNIDNTVLWGLERLLQYVEFFLNIKCDDILSECTSDEIRDIIISLGRSYDGNVNSFVKTIASLHDIIDYDMMEHMDIHSDIKALDDLSSQYHYEKLIELNSGKLERINDLTIQYAKIILVRNNTFDSDNILKEMNTIMSEYMNNIKSVTNISIEECNNIAQNYVKDCIESCFRSVLFRYTEHIVNEAKNKHKHLMNQQGVNVDVELVKLVSQLMRCLISIIK